MTGVSRSTRPLDAPFAVFGREGAKNLTFYCSHDFSDVKRCWSWAAIFIRVITSGRVTVSAIVAQPTLVSRNVKLLVAGALHSLPLECDQPVYFFFVEAECTEQWLAVRHAL